jgi:GNAT superfamily N-acetyltransferase
VGSLGRGITIRPAERADVPFLHEMLLLAARWRSGEGSIQEILADERLARYVEGWGRASDFAVIAVRSGKPIGAAWYRLFSEQAPGYGFIDESTPELSLAVARDHRGVGVGSAILDRLLDHAKLSGIGAVSLSVDAENPAVRLYERRGFEKVVKVDGSWTMRLELSAT